jgi:hypothetical protein
LREKVRDEKFLFPSIFKLILTQVEKLRIPVEKGFITSFFPREEFLLSHSWASYFRKVIYVDFVL